MKTFTTSAITLLAVGFAIDTVLDATGQLPWRHLTHPLDAYLVQGSGIVLQISICLFLTLAAILLSTLMRGLARLERNQKNTALSVGDIATAYRLSHAADRKGAFTLVGEFDQMRARMNHLRNHPELKDLQTELLEIAAQMGMQTRDLASTYSDENVKAAADFLRQRQQDLQTLADQVTIARTTCEELKSFITSVGTDELRLKQQLLHLERDVKGLLPTLDFALTTDRPRSTNVVALQRTAT